MHTKKIPLLDRYPLVLVAGGAGFIGSHLCRVLLEKYTVICLDDLHGGKRANIKGLLHHQRFTLVSYDLTRSIIDLIRKKTKIVFHAAGLDIIESGERGKRVETVINTKGTQRLIEKALQDKALFVLISPVNEEETGDGVSPIHPRLLAETIIHEYAKKRNLKACIIRSANLFGQGMRLDLTSGLTRLIKDINEKKRISFAASPQTVVHLTWISTFVERAVQVIRRENIKGKVYSIASEYALSLALLESLLKQIDHEYEINFDPQGITIPKSWSLQSAQTSLVLSKQQNLVTQLKQTIDFFQKKRQGEQRYKEYYWKDQELTSARFLLLLFIGSFFLFSFILPFVAVIGFGLMGSYRLQSAADHIKQGRFSAAREGTQASRQYFSFAKTGLQVLTPYFFVLQKRKEQQADIQLLSVGEDAADTVDHFSQVGITLGELFRESLKMEGSNTKPLLNKTISELNVSFAKASFLQKEIDEIVQSPIPELVKKVLLEKQKLLLDQKQNIALAQTLGSVLSDLLGFEGKRIYLLLLQNNMELRPGGGFIGSYGLLSVENGKLISFDIYDVYQADGQMRGHVDPPLPIRNYLHQPNWFLRDSNWDPDFESNAKQASWFLQKEVGTDVQGVIAVDVSFVQNLLAATGPRSIPEYKDVVSADTLFQKAEVYAQKDFFPGSTQKKDFLAAVSRRLTDSILHDEQIQWVSLLQAVKKGLDQKHMMFAFTNPAVQQVFVVNNWAGKLVSLPSDQDGFSDYRMVVEANLGVNKANYFIKRSIKDDIVIDEEGSTSGKLTIAYNNTGDSLWPAGTYLTYLRSLFPLHTVVTGISIDKRPLEASPSANTKSAEKQFLGVDQSVIQDKASVGFLVSVEPKTKKNVVISYILPSRYLLVGGSTTYSYLFQKQSGITDDPLQVTIAYPQGIQLKSTNASVFKSDHLVSLSTNLLQDQLFQVEFYR